MHRAMASLESLLVQTGPCYAGEAACYPKTLTQAPENITWRTRQHRNPGALPPTTRSPYASLSRACWKRRAELTAHWAQDTSPELHENVAQPIRSSLVSFTFTGLGNA
jgi:hypothetical protein